MINLELWEERKKELNYTFDELSIKSGIPKRTILGIFRKEVLTPRIDTVQAIEQALNINIENQGSTPALSSEEAELLALFGKMSHAQKARFVGFGEGMLGEQATGKKKV